MNFKYIIYIGFLNLKRDFSVIYVYYIIMVSNGFWEYFFWKDD